ncbi:hypothetical protein OV450_4366 [Actinobacteria bacterium OV450]|nr:hypothetical protein OV450_4366 [Actinobacteria bacterium OV450]
MNGRFPALSGAFRRCDDHVRDAPRSAGAAGHHGVPCTPRQFGRGAHPGSGCRPAARSVRRRGRGQVQAAAVRARPAAAHTTTWRAFCRIQTPREGRPRWPRAEPRRRCGRVGVARVLDVPGDRGRGDTQTPRRLPRLRMARSPATTYGGGGRSSCPPSPPTGGARLPATTDGLAACSPSLLARTGARAVRVPRPGKTRYDGVAPAPAPAPAPGTAAARRPRPRRVRGRRVRRCRCGLGGGAVFTYVRGNAVGASERASLTRRLGRGGGDPQEPVPGHYRLGGRPSLPCSSRSCGSRSYGRASTAPLPPGGLPRRARRQVRDPPRRFRTGAGRR